MLTLKSCKQIPPPHTLHSALFSMHFRHGFLDAFWHAFISIIDQILSPKGSPSGCHHEGRAPAQDTEYRIQDTRYKIQDTGYKIQNKIQDTKYKIQDTGYKIKGGGHQWQQNSGRTEENTNWKRGQGPPQFLHLWTITGG